MLNLNDRKWKEFKITDILGNSYNARAYHSDSLQSAGAERGIAYITRTNLNNGLFSVVKNKDDFLVNPKDSISLGAENAKYFYQPYKYITGNKMYYYKQDRFSKYTLLFLISCLNKSIFDCGFGYGMGLTGTRSDARWFVLPITPDGTPDYEFMEQYIRQMINHKHAEYRSFLNKQTNIKVLPSKKWKEFFISGNRGVFLLRSSNSSIDKNKLNCNGIKDTPYVSRSDIENGISMFVVRCQIRNYEPGNVITVGLDTQTAFYQPYSFHTGQNIQILKSEELTLYSALFILPLLKLQLKKFCWGGNGATLGRLQRTKIMLPVDNNEAPDYEYMEQYIKNKMYAKYNQYLKFCSNS